MNNMINSDKGFIDLLINLMNFTENNKNFIADGIICNLQDLSRTIINNISQEKNKNLFRMLYHSGYRRNVLMQCRHTGKKIGCT